MEQKISYNSSENWNEDRGSMNPSNSVKMTAGPRPAAVLNYSIQTGEEFSLEFTWKRVNPYNPSPPVEANNETTSVDRPVSSVSFPVIKPNTSIHVAKVLCSFGGEILPRPSDGKLRYVGGETRIVRIGKEITWDEMSQRTLTIYPEPHSIKYQLPGEDLDVLVSVSCEEDVQNMMDECSLIGSQKLRVFLVSDNESQLILDNVDGNSDVQSVNHNCKSDKNELNHESEMKSASDCESALRKMNEKDKSARFGVGMLRTAESSVGLSMHMVDHEPEHWSLWDFLPAFSSSLVAEFEDKNGVVDCGYMPFEAGVSAADQRQSSGPLKPDIVTLPSDYDISQTNDGVESLQSNQQTSLRPVVSDHQDVKRAIQPAGVPLVDKIEPKSAIDGESALTPLEIHERKMNEKDKSACFGVGASTSEHGDILIDINDRFPREFLFDIFRTAESSVGVVAHAQLV